MTRFLSQGCTSQLHGCRSRHAALFQGSFSVDHKQVADYGLVLKTQPATVKAARAGPVAQLRMRFRRAGASVRRVHIEAASRTTSRGRHSVQMALPAPERGACWCMAPKAPKDRKTCLHAPDTGVANNSDSHARAESCQATREAGGQVRVAIEEAVTLHLDCSTNAV